ACVFSRIMAHGAGRADEPGRSATGTAPASPPNSWTGACRQAANRPRSGKATGQAEARARRPATAGPEPLSQRDNRMNARRLIVAAAVAVAVALTAGGRAEDKEKKNYAKLLVGTWEVTKSFDKGPAVGATVEFTKDGKVKAKAKVDDKD